MEGRGADPDHPDQFCRMFSWNLIGKMEKKLMVGEHRDNFRWGIASSSNCPPSHFVHFWAMDRCLFFTGGILIIF